MRSKSVLALSVAASALFGDGKTVVAGGKDDDGE